MARHSVSNGLKSLKMVILSWRKRRVAEPIKFEDAELQASLDEDDGQTQEQLNVDRSTVDKRLKTMGKILKVGRWVPHELTESQKDRMKTEKSLVNCCSPGNKERLSNHHCRREVDLF